MKTDQKSWVESLTIWSALIAALLTVLPVVGPLVGPDDSAMINVFGDAVATLIQALGGVTATLMTIYRRMQASTALNQRAIRLKVCVQMLMTRHLCTNMVHLTFRCRLR